MKEKEELIALANALLNQHGYDQNGSKNTSHSQEQNTFEENMIKLPM